MKLPTLYKTSKTSAIQVCNIYTEHDTVFVEYGQLHGKLQTQSTICSGKNIGKANETTPSQQAELEAQAKFDKKVKSGYSTDASAPVTVALPQKVKPYLDNKHLVKFPCYSTPKLNGVNGTYWLLEDGSLKLTSRGGETYPAIHHLEEQVLYVMKLLDTDCLNGELYIHGEHLQDIQSAVKKPNKLTHKLQFHIFELPNIDLEYIHKTPMFKSANKHLSDLLNTYVFAIPPTLVESVDELDHWYNIAMLAGFEGTVIYNLDATYKFNQRSSQVLKYKKTLDLEVLINSYEVDKNGHPVFNCTYNSKSFKVKPKGTDAERKAIIANFNELYANKWYTIEYETLSKDGVPLKPVGVGLRDCDPSGNPLT